MSPPNKKYALPRNLTYDKTADQYRFRNPLNNKKTYFGSDKKKAIERANKVNLAIELQKQQDLLNKSGAPSFSFVAALYIENVVPNKPWATSTKKNRLWTINVFMNDFGDRVFQGIDRVFLGDWLTQRCETADCYKKHRDLLMDIWNFAISRQLTESNEAEKTLKRSSSVKIPANQKKRKRLTVREFWKIHEKAEPWLQLAMELSLATGQSRSEICNLKYSDIRDGYIYIIRQKTSSNSDMAFIAIKETAATTEIVRRSREDRVACPYIVHRAPSSRRQQHLKNKPHWAAIMPEYLSKTFAKARAESES